METKIFTTYANGNFNNMGYPYSMEIFMRRLNDMGTIPSVEQSYQTNAYGILTKVTYTVTYKKA